MSTKKFVLTYPPEYDGELHIRTQTTPVGQRFRHMEVTFTIALLQPDETEAQALRRVAYDILDKIPG